MAALLSPLPDTGDQRSAVKVSSTTPDTDTEDQRSAVKVSPHNPTVVYPPYILSRINH